MLQLSPTESHSPTRMPSDVPRDERAQWRIELDNLLRHNKVSLGLSVALLVAGIALCVGLKPQTRDYCDVVVGHTNAADNTIANWTLSRTTTGLDLANEHCKGGVAHDLTFHEYSFFVPTPGKHGCANLNERCGNAAGAGYVPCAGDAKRCCIKGKGAEESKGKKRALSKHAAPAPACADPLGCFVLTCQQPRLSRKAFLTIAVTSASLIAMMRDVAPDISMLAATLVLLLWPWGAANGGGNILTGAEAWQGFSNEAVLSVGALFIVAKGVDETGAVDRMFRGLLGRTRNLFAAQLRLLLPVAVMSAFMNNTPIVAMLIPVVDGWARRIGKPKALFMMPLSFASMLGGMCTMIGTSTNLVVQGMLMKNNPNVPPFGLFDLVPIGGPCALVGIVYMAFFSRFLPDNDAKEAAAGDGAADTARDSGVDENGDIAIEGLVDDSTDSVAAADTAANLPYVVGFVVESEKLDGGTLDDTGITTADGMALDTVMRPARRDSGEQAGSYAEVGLELGGETPLRVRDLVIFRGTAEGVAKLRRSVRGLVPASRAVALLGRHRRRRRLVEARIALSVPPTRVSRI